MVNYKVVITLDLFQNENSTIISLACLKMDAPLPRDVATAAAQGDLIAVTKLIAQGADVNRKSKDGMTPLCVASFWGYVDIVEYLLNHGADLNAENSSTLWTPLHCAAFQGHGPVIMRLMSRKPDLTRRDMRGRTAADFASALDSIWPFFAAAGCKRTPKETLIKLDIVYKLTTESMAPQENIAHFSRPGSSYAVRSQPTMGTSKGTFSGDVLAVTPEESASQSEDFNQKQMATSLRLWQH